MRRSTTLSRLLTMAAGGALLLSACSSSGSDVPEALAFASGNCSGDVVVEIDANLAEGEITSGGPYAVSVPAGTYNIEMESWADLDEVDEPNERWYFTTDSGYTSPLIPDPGTKNVIRQTYFDQVLASDVSSISVFHMLPGDSVKNSVVAKCVGFTLVTTPVVTTTAAPTSTETPTTAEAPATTDAPTTTEAPATTEAPTTTAVAPASTALVAPPTTRGGDEIPDQLALTGPNDLAASLALVGAALALAGVAALGAARRAEDSL